ncbi:hypothetical protein Pst134EA_004795 [Puccinia striiformis f. sp. tritici]|uniref:hypothetical protein n=1 Tax=Puccinia striiformis f. sp. tritici TaxID=168172 RepID=UPI002008D169|nr:hypothetical protein Pst134EA_004795 [Puccinia striiformis f. sp. tritici]KAH9470881.1 hypothetical protein Pst134EA_004795 [Puccinia striiformis f. sp. tritici]
METCFFPLGHIVLSFAWRKMMMACPGGREMGYNHTSSTRVSLAMVKSRTLLKRPMTKSDLQQKHAYSCSRTEDAVIRPRLLIYKAFTRSFKAICITISCSFNILKASTASFL